ncbi:SDR family NAD(P)-dependent oxidoreductase [Paenibacillus lutrae]|uniref:SDR family NAD(P)-dependent oxidoreductase n=1 Tax=Paenibacillus lutrae TaxID=2078573 RepID=A0A7X3FF83_9BACL|nr:SDR family NAD(P)-dependent oxidoreductase [Paenibacillus lutrae]MVO98624.1 SDR family NAD(P)-dependent oxidoreductase [Paenibacillus lutrae]
MINQFEHIRRLTQSGSLGKDFSPPAIDKLDKREIAIIGISARMAACNHVDQFWEQLQAGKDFIRTIPSNRRADQESLFRSQGIQADAIEYAQIGYLDQVDRFDPHFFSLSPKEASFIDPSQRLLLTEIWKAIEDAGYGRGQLAGSKTGVYVGYSNDPLSDYKTLIFNVCPEQVNQSVTGNLKSVLASRISYLLDLKGPAMVVDTSCSSSLVAVHLACQALRVGECRTAIAGGVNIRLLNIEGEEHNKVGIESSDGRTRTFDASSDGTGAGEGVAAIVLKPLNQAVLDGDHIYAVIKSSAVNQDGNSIGLTAPNSRAQSEVIVTAWQEAGIDPETISYIEAHGTATHLGDPVEIDGLRQAFEQHTAKRQFCAIGSVKTNIGHLDSCAGMAGLVKMTLALYHKQIPPHLHFKRPNRRIQFEGSPLYVNDRLIPFPASGHPRRGGVSSFGLSGTNCHLVLEEAPLEELSAEQPSTEILTLSADDEAMLKVVARSYLDILDTVEAECRLRDFCYSVNTGKKHRKHRAALLVNSIGAARQKLQALLLPEGAGAPEAPEAPEVPETAPLTYRGSYEIIPETVTDKGPNQLSVQDKKRLDAEAEKQAGQYARSGGNGSEAELAEIGRLYVQGADIPWERVYAGGSRRRMRLPVYPLRQERCWLPLSGAEEDRESSGSGYYTVSWTPAVSDVSEHTSARQDAPSPVLLITGEGRLGTDLADLLRSEGRTVLTARLGTSFVRVDDHSYQITSSAEDYGRVLEDAAERGIGQILYMPMASPQDEIKQVSQLRDKLRSGFLGLFNLNKALNGTALSHKAELVVISLRASVVTGEETSVFPENYMLYVLGKSIRLEGSAAKVRCIDMDGNEDAKHIQSELYTPGSHEVVAYRDGIRFVEELDLLTHVQRKVPAVSLKEGGVYLITGGSGELGTLVARSLASACKVKLALLQRSASLDEDLVQAVRESGSEVHGFRADISDEVQVRQALTGIKETLGAIDGVIHCAGAGVGERAGSLHEQKEEEVMKLLAPKVMGTWLLHEETKREQLDFFIMFSSISSISGGIHDGGYSAANGYLDSFAGFRQLDGSHGTAIQWPMWQVTAGKYGISDNTHMCKTIPDAKALSVFHDLISASENRVVAGEPHPAVIDALSTVSIRMSERLAAEVGRLIPDRPAFSPKEEEVVLKETQLSSIQPVHHKIAQMWANVLGVKAVGVYESFYELGGDSILATRLFRLLEQEYPGLLHVSDIFSYPTIHEMAVYIEKLSKHMSQPEDDDELDSILNRLAEGQLTSAEASKLLKTVSDNEWKP